MQAASESEAAIRRTISTDSFPALDHWISQDKQLVLRDSYHPGHISDLYVTLPTRDGTRHAYVAPKIGDSLGFGHHLAFFHPRLPEVSLRPDGTDAHFCPPEPFIRRMWAGGRMEWHRPVRVGEDGCSIATVHSVEKKGFDRGTPMVFVKQYIEIKDHAQSPLPNIIEERTHVYLALGTSIRAVRKVDSLPRPTFSLTYTPSFTTLFRFSALTFNGHYIHLDRDYAQHSEGYPERLVHGPLTALMLLETLAFHYPNVRMRSFDYRALNPVVVDRPCILRGAWEDGKKVFLWAEDEQGIVGMTGKVLCD
ncbi:hypothetical protein K488DRAFT_76873 [Vararia minispora EC-137]|uniref:Uncharacterized protein n=1 Tax=Vararia minispora EC-137 TaxID=1314806 RepID=A0ACB8QU76_9AGAM|nr:hypothetical protein K488DRAFT_76873 [Vararia minispora EC-137]